MMAGALSESRRSSDALELLLQGHNLLPTELQISHAAEALKLLNLALLGEDYHETTQTSPTSYTSTNQGVTLLLAPFGSYGLGCWDGSAEIPCCIAGTPSEKIFYSIARKRLRRTAGNNITILKSGKSANMMFEIDISGIRFTLQYHQSPYVSRLVVPDPFNEMQSSTNAQADGLEPVPSIFQMSYLACHTWLK